MCWKQEWAAAIGDIQDAIEHIDIAHSRDRWFESTLAHSGTMKIKKYLLLAALFALCLTDGEINPVEIQLLLSARARGKVI